MTDTKAGQDPRRAARLVSAVQHFGLFSAAAVVERFTTMVDEVVADDLHDQIPSGVGDVDPAGLATDTIRLLEGYLRFLESVGAMITSWANGGGRKSGLERVSLPKVSPGMIGRTSVWIHNTTSETVPRIDFVVTDLAAPGGAIIAAQSISVLPTTVEGLEPWRSQELRLEIDVPADLPPGHYHGLLLGSHPQENAIALLLEVVGRGEEAS